MSIPKADVRWHLRELITAAIAIHATEKDNPTYSDAAATAIGELVDGMSDNPSAQTESLRLIVGWLVETLTAWASSDDADPEDLWMLISAGSPERAAGPVVDGDSRL